MIEIFWQPIIELETMSAVGHEALARVAGQGGVAILDWLSAGAPDLATRDMHLVTRTMATKHLQPKGCLLFVNIRPETVALVLGGTRRLPQKSGVVWEISEETGLGGWTAETVRRALGDAYALDDVGQGRADLNRVVQWRPPWIKIERELINGIEDDVVRRRLVAGLVTAASGYGARVIAEGIETQEQLRVVQELGVQYGQGFLWGKPSLPADVLRECPVLASSTRAAPGGY